MNHKKIDKKQKNQIIKSMKKSFQRQESFRHLKKHTGRRVKSSLKQLHAVNESNAIIHTHVEKEQIENVIFKYNTKCYRAAC